MTTASSVMRIFVTLCLVCSVAGAAAGGSAGVGVLEHADLCDTTAGDVNLDGSVNFLDVVLLIDFFICVEELTPEQIANSDVTGDCLVNRADLDYLMAFLNEGGPAPLPCVCAEPAVTACRCTPTGDVNLDGSLNHIDIVLLSDFVVCKGELTPEQLIQSDVNGDCVVDLPDVYYLMEFLYEEGPGPEVCMCVEKETCRCTPTGDVNLDGSVNILDILLLMDFLLCEVELTPDQLIQADVNGDCVVDQADLDYFIEYQSYGEPAPATCLCVEKEVPVCE